MSAPNIHGNPHTHAHFPLACPCLADVGAAAAQPHRTPSFTPAPTLSQSVAGGWSQLLSSVSPRAYIGEMQVGWMIGFLHKRQRCRWVKV